MLIVADVYILTEGFNSTGFLRLVWSFLLEDSDLFLEVFLLDILALLFFDFSLPDFSFSTIPLSIYNLLPRGSFVSDLSRLIFDLTLLNFREQLLSLTEALGL
jgi:hypothetical protein